MSSLEELVEKVKARGAKRVLVQLPEGLITRSRELEEKLSGEGIQSYVSLDPCYGACDLRDCEAKRLECDLLVHVGHSDFGVKSSVPVLYYEWFFDWDPVRILEKNLEKLPEKMGLVSSVNYLDSLAIVREHLENRGKTCFLAGQILGCDVSEALKIEKMVDCYLYVGSGAFHPLGLALKTKKPVFSLNPDKQILGKVDPDLFLRQREAAKALAGDCSSFGILVSTKPGQIQTEKILNVKKKLESEGKKAFIFAMDCITPEKLLGLNLDCYINCACPRIAIENRTSFQKPILNPDEITF
ncbi:MAG: diphthamide biosynthesis enzyme Dph2 [archaeon]|nr:MAG: diphthamide biosynthesis enzyme Dph2 [archaeon]